MSIDARQRPAVRSVPPSWRVITNLDIGSVDPARAPSGPAFRMTVAVCVLLAKHFDDEKGLFEPDWDDQRVAAESGSQLVYVVSFRRKYYGELVVPAAAE
jgi:hypothetical protein